MEEGPDEKGRMEEGMGRGRKGEAETKEEGVGNREWGGKVRAEGKGEWEEMTKGMKEAQEGIWGRQR
jgi:hypothetical protein